MTRIRNLLARDLDQTIEEIIKVDQTNEQSVRTEIDEYVVTDRINAEYRQILDAMASAPNRPDEGVGVWISGFFGSGKSSFAKNLGYVLQNSTVQGIPAGELFKRRFNDAKVVALIDSINAQIPTEAVMFDVSVDRGVKRVNERIAEIMYTVLLRELDYAEDFDIANLEIELEREGKLGLFEQRCQELYGTPWRMVRKGAQRLSRASAVLHTVEPVTYTATDSWTKAVGSRTADITVNQFVERAFDLVAIRRPGKALAFIIDEVGQYVARSADKIEDLRAVVERFGQESKDPSRNNIYSWW